MLFRSDVVEYTFTIVGAEDNPTDVQVTEKIVKESDVEAGSDGKKH